MAAEASRVVGASGLTFAYAAATRPAVKNLSFNIGRGEIFGLLGPSGAGKSTTQKVLIGLLRHYEGGVSVLGRDLTRLGGQTITSRSACRSSCPTIISG